MPKQSQNRRSKASESIQSPEHIEPVTSPAVEKPLSESALPKWRETFMPRQEEAAPEGGDLRAAILRFPRPTCPDELRPLIHQMDKLAARLGRKEGTPDERDAAVRAAIRYLPQATPLGPFTHNYQYMERALRVVERSESDAPDVRAVIGKIAADMDLPRSITNTAERICRRNAA